MSLYHYKAYDLEAINLSTVEMTVQLGFHVTRRLRIRLDGVAGPPPSPGSRVRGRLALAGFIASCDNSFAVHSFRNVDRIDSWRAVVVGWPSPPAGEVPRSVEGVSLSQWLIEGGYAVARAHG